MIEASLKRIEAWAQGVGASLKLRKGLAEGDLAKAEKTLGRELPRAYRELLLFADGQEDDPSFPWMPGCDRLAPLESVVAQAGDERELAEEYPPPDEETEDGLLRVGRYHADRLPIAGSAYWDGDVTFLDFAPGTKGKAGQLVTMVTECDFVVLGGDLGTALARYADALESGALEWRDGAVVPKGEEPHAAHPAERFAATIG